MKLGHLIEYDYKNFFFSKIIQKEEAERLVQGLFLFF